MTASPSNIFSNALSFSDEFYMDVQLSITPASQRVNQDTSDHLVNAHREYAQRRYETMRDLLEEGKVLDSLIICRSFLESSVRCWNILLADPSERSALEKDYSKHLVAAKWRRDRKVHAGISLHLPSLNSSDARFMFEALLSAASTESAGITKREASDLNHRYSFKEQLKLVISRSARVQPGLDFSVLDYLHSLTSHMLHADLFGLIYEAEPHDQTSKISQACSILEAALGVWYYHVLFTAHYHDWDGSFTTELYARLRAARPLFETA